MHQTPGKPQTTLTKTQTHSCNGLEKTSHENTKNPVTMPRPTTGSPQPIFTAAEFGKEWHGA